MGVEPEASLSDAAADAFGGQSLLHGAEVGGQAEGAGFQHHKGPRSLGRAGAEEARLGEASDQLRQARISMGRIRGTFEPMIDAMPNIGIILLLLIGSWQVSIGRLDTGQVVQAAALFGLLGFPMRVFGFFLQELPRAVVVSARLDKVMDVEREPVGRLETAPQLPDTPLSVRFESVTCRHGDDPAVIDGLDLEVPAGKVVALVGATGSGKSTLCELIPRLVDPESGVVRIGGIDLRFPHHDNELAQSEAYFGHSQVLHLSLFFFSFF
jgi:ABC-type multidrug transport system fused ATPase/permease subunit